MEKHSYAFAYFADGQFIGWYADSFGSVRKAPKLYTDLERMIPVLTSNLTHKMSKINSTSFDEEKDKVVGLQALSLATFDSEEQLRGRQIELRAVICPVYDGPNPDFNEESYQDAVHVRSEKLKRFLTENGVDPQSGASSERTKLVDLFNHENPNIQCDNWIYADFSKVKEWALNEPTEFVAVLKPEL